MTLHPLATRVPKELEEEIKEIMNYLRVEKAQAVRMILEIGISEWRKRTVLELLWDGKVTFAKAAKLAKLDLWDLADTVKDRKLEWIKIPPGQFDEEVKKAKRDLRE